MNHADPRSAEAPWAIRWSDGRLTNLRAPHPGHVEWTVARRRGSTWDGWPDGNRVSVLGVESVRYLEPSVAPRRELNQRKYGRVWIGDTELSWSGPSEGVPPRGGIDLAGRTFPRRIRRLSGHLWGYVWSPSELVLFTSLDFAAAGAWARRSGYGVKGEVNSASIERVERLELHLAPDELGFAPTCYRVWVQGFKVGWPPTDVQTSGPGGSNPETPIAAEMRLPIPTYSRTRAYASGGRRRIRGQDRSAEDVGATGRRDAV